MRGGTKKSYGVSYYDMPVVQKSNKTPEWVEGSVTFAKTDCLPPGFWGSGQFSAMRDSGPFYERHFTTLRV